MPGNYSVRFTSDTAYEVLDNGATPATQVTTGTYSPNGTSVSIQRHRSADQRRCVATGDAFTVSTAGTEDMFTGVSNILTSLQRPSSSTAQNGLFATEMGTALQQIDNSLERLSDVRSKSVRVSRY